MKLNAGVELVGEGLVYGALVHLREHVTCTKPCVLLRHTKPIIRNTIQLCRSTRISQQEQKIFRVFFTLEYKEDTEEK